MCGMSGDLKSQRKEGKMMSPPTNKVNMSCSTWIQFTLTQYVNANGKMNTTAGRKCKTTKNATKGLVLLIGPFRFFLSDF